MHRQVAAITNEIEFKTSFFFHSQTFCANFKNLFRVLFKTFLLLAHMTHFSVSQFYLKQGKNILKVFPKINAKKKTTKKKYNSDFSRILLLCLCNKKTAKTAKNSINVDNKYIFWFRNQMEFVGKFAVVGGLCGACSFSLDLSACIRI